MNLDNFNNLIELFFYQAEKQDNKSVFLQWLNPNNKKTFTWEETKINIFKISKTIKKIIKEGDRCLLVSENRPEWFVSDLAIMLSGGITVPAYTTYTEEDYKYLIKDCEPSLVIVSNNEMLKKLSNTINEKDFIKKVITIDEVNKVTNNLNLINKENLIKEDNFINQIVIRKLIENLSPNLVINCIGIIKQNLMINDSEKSIYLNSFFPKILHQICESNQIRFLTFGTDCVFKGTKGFYRENNIENYCIRNF